MTSATPSFRPGAVWCDTSGVPINAHGGGILWHEGTYYWFGEHKIAGEAGNNAHVGVHVYASTDLYHWRDAGIALEVSDDPRSPIVRGCILERPKVLFCAATGRFVMWFHLEPPDAGYAGALSGVAVADAPTGPYRLLRVLRPNAGVWPINAAPESCCQLDAEEAAWLASLELTGGPVPYYPRDLCFRRDFARGQMARDQTLFLDDDGDAYHVYASEENGVLHVSLLTGDFTRPAGRYARVFVGGFHEAPAIFKRGGRYFLFSSGCTGWAPNAARVSVAASIWGPWRELGNPCLGDGPQIATSFDSQPTYVLPVAGRQDALIYIGDRWRPENAIDGRYVWLPVEWRHDVPVMRWRETWDLSVFDGTVVESPAPVLAESLG